MKGIQQRRTFYGSLDCTIVTIEPDEGTPLLVDCAKWPGNCNNNKININNNNTEKPKLNSNLSFWSVVNSSRSNGNNYSAASAKSFKSNFTEFKVLALTLSFAVAISVAIYLLVIESRMPPITSSLVLVSHDIWSRKIIPKHKHLEHNNVNHIVLMKAGSRNCGTSGACLEALMEMQNDESEELPYNFLIGGDGQVYEARGWNYQSNIEGIPQHQSLVIGIIGNYDQSSPKALILRTIKSLIRESFKRNMINRNYYIYGLLRIGHDRTDYQQFFKELIEWPQYRGIFNNY